MTKEAKVKGYSKGRFSFNRKGGRCEACCGDGIIKIEMHFLPDVYVPCDTCKGKRYNKETLAVKYKGKNITEVLDMTVEEALTFFENIPGIYSKLNTIGEVGLGYIKLGQSSTTLSGGEAQRVKLATELSKRMTGKTIYILDEPTTGLHMADVHKLVNILHRLSDAGNTVVVIEHNLDVIKTSDYIIDLGPEGGDKGGYLVGTGSPEEIAVVPGQSIAKILERNDMTLDDIKLIEINEAFAAMPLVSTKILAKNDEKKWKELQEKTNVNGGAVAIGHPVGASANRITMTLARELARRGGGYGIAAICGGLAQGEAILIKV